MQAALGNWDKDRTKKTTNEPKERCNNIRTEPETMAAKDQEGSREWRGAIKQMRRGKLKLRTKKLEILSVPSQDPFPYSSHDVIIERSNLA